MKKPIKQQNKALSATIIESNLVYSDNGFTLVELIVVIVIIGVLAIAVLPRFSDQSPSKAVVFMTKHCHYSVTHKKQPSRNVVLYVLL